MMGCLNEGVQNDKIRGFWKNITWLRYDAHTLSGQLGSMG